MAYLEPTWVYAILLGIIIFTVRILQLLHVILAWVIELDSLPSPGNTRLGRYLTTFAFQYLTHRPVIGVWQRLDILCQVGYLAVSAVIVLYSTPTPAEAGLRAGTLSLINALFLLAGPHLGFLADVLGLSLGVYQRLHRMIGLTCILLALIHVTINVSIGGGAPFPGSSFIPFAIVATVSLAFQLVFLSSRLKRTLYELALRAHQVLAVLFAYACWRHLPSAGLFPGIYLVAAVGIFAASAIVQLGMVLVSNRLGFPSCDLSYEHGIIRAKVRLRRPLKIDAGQYINLWIPAGVAASLQTHPFAVISWSPEPQKELELVIQPRRGLTRQLAKLSKGALTTTNSDRKTISYGVIFTGPHGRAPPIHTYNSVIIIATGIGIAAVAPYLTKLIHYAYEGHAPDLRSIHVVWELVPKDLKEVFMPLINTMLGKDREYKLRISMYKSEETQPYGSHGLVCEYSGSIPLEQILPQNASETEKTVVAVSASSSIQIDISRILRARNLDSVSLEYLNYQP